MRELIGWLLIGAGVLMSLAGLYGIWRGHKIKKEWDLAEYTQIEPALYLPLPFVPEILIEVVEDHESLVEKAELD